MLQSDPYKFNLLLASWDCIPQYKTMSDTYEIVRFDHPVEISKLRQQLLAEKLKKSFGE